MKKQNIKILLSLFIAMMTPTVTQAGMITVFSDVDTFYNGSLAQAGNQQLAKNMLGGGDNVLISRQRNGGLNTGIGDIYNTTAGVSAQNSSSELSLSYLSNFDLVILDLGYSESNFYDDYELGALSSYLLSGGNIGLIGESYENSNVSVNEYNYILSGLGSSIRYESNERCCSGYQLADSVIDTPLTTGVSSFMYASGNNLLGGNAAVSDNGFNLVAFETFGDITPVPVPASFSLFVIGMLGFRLMQGRKKQGAK